MMQNAGMGWMRLLLPCLTCLCLAACGEGPSGSNATENFTISAWLWRMPQPPVPGAGGEGWENGDGPVLDRLYLDVASARRREGGWRLEPSPWPEGLPEAARLVAVIRVEDEAAPDMALIHAIAAALPRWRERATGKGRPLAGVQVDWDCPTARLGLYARWLRELRAALPPGTALSITSLLDWLRPGTRLSEVLAQVDEHTPQFYDLDANTERIAVPPDAPELAAHAARLAELGTPYRAGLASFGRVQFLDDAEGKRRVRYAHDSPLSLSRREDLRLEGWRVNDSGELVARYRSANQTVAQVVVPTVAGAGRAVAAARALGGRCRGVVFFRWPGRGESLVLAPDELRAAVEGRETAQESGQRPWPTSGLEVRDGGCSPLHCLDLFWRPARRFDTLAGRVSVRLSRPARLVAPGDVALRRVDETAVEARVPPLAGERVLHLGRVFTEEPAEARLENAAAME